MRLEELLALRPFKGRQIRVHVDTIKHVAFGNCDDREEDLRDEKLASLEFEHFLDNIYVKDCRERLLGHEVLPQYMSVKKGKLLIPFQYSHSPILSLRKYAETIDKEVTRIHTGDVVLPVRAFCVWFDGYGRVTPDGDKYTQADADAYPKYPLLANKGCEYLPKQHAIKGETKNLLEGLRPLW